MDNATFGPDRRGTLACAGGVVVALGLAAATDAAGRILFGLAAVVLLAYVVTDLIYSPRLVADASGLRVHSPFTSVQLTWADVDRVQADSRLRLGLRSVTLEVDAGETLVVLSRRALGQDPELVAEVIGRFVPPGVAT